MLAKSTEEVTIVGNVFIDTSAEIQHGCKIGPNVSILGHVRIGEGVRISNAILLEDSVIQPNAVLANVILGWTSVVGSWARIEGVIPVKENDDDEVYRNPKKEAIVEADRVIKDGVTTIGCGVFIEPELLIRNCIILPNKAVDESALN